MSRRARRDLDCLDPPLARRVAAALQVLPAGDVSPLAASPRGRYGLRVGDRRVIFSRPEPEVVVVERVAHRREAYR
ncbi:MAG: type II toxin-antitoxin system RelE/ParE family toxin [Dehalococcoidia bacterium]